MSCQNKETKVNQDQLTTHEQGHAAQYFDEQQQNLVRASTFNQLYSIIALWGFKLCK